MLRSDSLRTLLSLAVTNDWDIHSLDVVAAFLNGEVEEELYMRQIPGYEDGTQRVLRIKGSLYGLKQAPRIWNRVFREKVATIGYHPIPSEPCISLRIRDGHTAILAVYVDDIAVFTTRGDAGEVKTELLGLFEMRDLG